MAERFVRILLEPTNRTDLPCISCGGSKTQYAVRRFHGFEPNAGLHKDCLPDVKAMRGEGSKGRP